MALIDCRPHADYCMGHVKGAASFPWQELPQRIFELPANDYPLVLLGDVFSIQQASAFLLAKSYRIEQCTVLNPEHIAAYQQANQWEQGDSLYRLWQPSSLVRDFVERGLPVKTGLDIGCGAGRDVVYLAQQGWQMTGIDYLPRNVDKAQRLAKRHKVQAQFICSDMSQTLPTQCFDLIVVVRYLHRPLLAQLDSLLNPSGFLLYQTFMRGAEQFGSPKNPAHLLQQGELAQQFSQYKIWRDDVECLPDGRPVSAFMAQKL